MGVNEVVYSGSGLDIYQVLNGNDLFHVNSIPVSWAYEQDNTNWLSSISGATRAVEIVFCLTLEEIVHWISAPLESPAKYRRIITAIQLERGRDSEFLDERVVATAVISGRLMDRYGWTLAEYRQLPLYQIILPHPLLADQTLVVEGPAIKGESWSIWCRMHSMYVFADSYEQAMAYCANIQDYCIGCGIHKGGKSR